MKLAKLVFAAGALFAASVVLSFIHPWGDLRSSGSNDSDLMAASSLHSDVRQTLKTKCADCHSNNTHWPVYSRFAPGSWLMERDVYEGRKHLNLSNWPQYDTDTQIGLLAKIASEARSGEMPVRQYLLLHPSARLSDQEQQTIYNWAKAERKRMKSAAPNQ
jgi:cytochrome c